VYREDFENWIKAAFKDDALANELARLRNADVKGEDLRKGIMTAMAEKYGF